jgi:hypothetical protein
MIINGHHRYIASLLTKFAIERIESSTTSATSVTNWISVDFIDYDYDSLDDIQFHNEKDAAYNDMTIEKLVNLLNKA